MQNYQQVWKKVKYEIMASPFYHLPFYHVYIITLSPFFSLFFFIFFLFWVAGFAGNLSQNSQGITEKWAHFKFNTCVMCRKLAKVNDGLKVHLVPFDQTFHRDCMKYCMVSVTFHANIYCP